MYRVQLIGAEEFRKWLAETGDSLKGRTAKARRAWKVVGMMALGGVDEDFKGLSAGRSVRGRRWPIVSFVTAALRRKGPLRTKMTSLADIEARRATLPILIDSGLLRNSFAPGRAGAVFDVGATYVEVGTALPQAGTLAEGGETRFKYSDETERRLEQNVRKILPGAKPRYTRGYTLVTTRTKRGLARVTAKRRKSGATKHWNRDFFLVRARLKKMDGKAYPVPARPMIVEPGPARMAEFGQAFMAIIREESP